MSEFKSEQESGGGSAGRQKTLDSFLQQSKAKKNVFECPICACAVEVWSEAAFNAHLDKCLRDQEQGGPKAEQNQLNGEPGKLNGVRNGEENQLNDEQQRTNGELNKGDGNLVGDKSKQMGERSKHIGEKNKQIREDDDPGGDDFEPIGEISKQIKKYGKPGSDKSKQIGGRSKQTKDEVEPGGDESNPQVVCPICNERIAVDGSDNDDDVLVNRHVDECLNRQWLKAEKRERGTTTDLDPDRDDGRPPPSKRAKSSNSIEGYLTKGLNSR